MSHRLEAEVICAKNRSMECKNAQKVTHTKFVGINVTASQFFEGEWYSIAVGSLKGGTGKHNMCVASVGWSQASI